MCRLSEQHGREPAGIIAAQEEGCHITSWVSYVPLVSIVIWNLRNTCGCCSRVTRPLLPSVNIRIFSVHCEGCEIGGERVPRKKEFEKWTKRG